MSDRVGAATHQTPEEIEMQWYRQSQPRLGVEALGNLDELGERLVTAANHYLSQWELDARARGVYVVGSFAAGEATEVVSDLDVRIVLDESISPVDEELIAEELRTECSDIAPDAAGYLDARMGTKEPDEPRKRIWRKA